MTILQKYKNTNHVFTWNFTEHVCDASVKQLGVAFYRDSGALDQCSVER